MKLSLKWFRSTRDEELETLKVEEQKLKNKILQAKLVPETPKSKPVDSKPYKFRKMVDSVLTIVLKNGDILTKSNATIQDFKNVEFAITENDLYTIASSVTVVEERERKKEQEETEKAYKIYAGFETLKGLSEFEVEGNSVYFRGIKRSLPTMLVERLAQIVEAHKNSLDILPPVTENLEFQSLKKFWLKCCLNPSAKSAEDLYKFLNAHHFKIDNHGNFYAYRRVKSVGDGNKELVKFISNAYSKVKAVWKKKPIDYYVWAGDDGELYFDKSYQGDGINYLHGNLHDLYVDLPNMEENRYTSAHTGLEDYRVGKVISMPRNDGDDNNQISCSKGFHAASKAYDYSGFGDTPILVIINPMDVLAVPRNEDGKLRTCRWFFASTLDKEEQYILDNDDFDVSELGDVFEQKCAENLEEYIKKGFAEEVKRHTFDLAPINHLEVSKIVRSLDEMRDSISKRVSEV